MSRTIMIQGTMSNVGKSLLTAALCRIFRQDGYCVAPFKSQNMALNSFVTEDGLEIGRAQAMQAEAAGIVPRVWMNPILLKPTTDVGSQVIVNGEVVGNYTAKEYFEYKKQLVSVIQNAFSRLEEQADIIVIEGAGSPAEINLKDHDIVNMGLAQLLQAPVLLAGDIDRGGVFAQLYGTMALLEAEERRHVKGLILNKFRGDLSILEPGLRRLEELCGVPVTGVVPYLRLDIDEEDSLSRRLEEKPKQGLLDIAVIRLPHLSNYTDFSPLERTDAVSLRYVNREKELGEPDLLILPGTKSTMADLLWMRQNGLEASVKKLAEKDVPILGICGGYQMLGETLEDPENTEGGGSLRGMELLPVRTVFSLSKTRQQTKGKTLALPLPFGEITPLPVEGYEIHCGRSETSGKPFLQKADGSFDGCRNGSVCGTYLHGLFDEGQFADALVQSLLQKKGIALTTEPVCGKEYKEQQYDLLAQAVREHIDMEQVYTILEKGMAK